MTNQITLSRLASNPLIAYSIQIPEPTLLELSEYEKSAFPAVLGNLVGISISHVIPKYKLGRIWSFDIAPREKADPILIYSPLGDLKKYYSVWSDVMWNGLGMFRNRKIKQFDESIEIFVKSAGMLDIHETVFAVIEMLKFKNDVLLNRQYE
jgi:hypothetical protein